MFIGYAQAAAILGCSTSTVSRAVERGELTVRKNAAGRTMRPAFERQQVVDLRDTWREQARVSAERRRARQAQRDARRTPAAPDEVHDWVGTVQAAELLGVSRVAVQRRTVRGTLPVVVHDEKRWFRADHMRLLGRAREARLTGEVVPATFEQGSDARRRTPQQRRLLQAAVAQLYGEA